MAEKCLLFLYDRKVASHFKTPRTASQVWTDRIKGELCQVGEQMVATRVGESSCGWIDGQTMEIDADELSDLDALEELESGEFRRMVVETTSGYLAWVYEFCGSLPIRS